MMPMKTVLTYGTFDLFHIGHLRLLERLRQLGGRLIVAVSTDEFNAGKGKRAVIPFAERAAIVGALKCVDLVIAERTWDQKRQDIIDYDVDIFGMGSDWVGKFDDLQDICNVVYLERTPLISTTGIKASCAPASPVAVPMARETASVALSVELSHRSGSRSAAE